jgi:hypothetical protein
MCLPSRCLAICYTCNNFPNFTDFQPPATAFSMLILGTKVLESFFNGNYGTKWSWPNPGTIPASSWRDPGQSQKTFVRTTVFRRYSNPAPSKHHVANFVGPSSVTNVKSIVLGPLNGDSILGYLPLAPGTNYARAASGPRAAVYWPLH